MTHVVRSMWVAARLALAVCAASTPAEPQTRGVTVTTPDGKAVEFYEESHALVVGMIDYRAGWRRLPGVERDLPAVEAALKAHGFTVRVERNLTREGFDKVLREFIAARGRNLRNRLVIYFAGHGHTEAASDGRQFGFVVPVDAPLPAADPARFRERAISMAQVEVYAREIESRHALMVFDSCFSGSLFDVSRGGLPPAVAARMAEPVRQFITSGTAGQEVPDESEFRRQFVAALDGEADLSGDGYITASEVGLFLETRVPRYTRDAQLPQSGKLRDGRLDKGDLVFVSPRGPVATPGGGTPPTVSAGELSQREELAYWETVRESRDRTALIQFLKRFPQSRFRSVAERRLEDLDREDPAATAGRFLEALRTGDLGAAYGLAADRVRQFTPESSFGAMVKASLREPVAPNRQLLYDERSPDGSIASLIFQAGDQYQRVTLVRDGTRWGAWSYRWMSRSAAAPAIPPPHRGVGLQFLTSMNAARPAEAYALLASTTRVQLTGPQFGQLNGPYLGLGRPRSRELVYEEQDSVMTAFAVYRSVFDSGSFFERVSVVLDGDAWRVSAFWASLTSAR